MANGFTNGGLLAGLATCAVLAGAAPAAAQFPPIIVPPGGPPSEASPTPAPTPTPDPRPRPPSTTGTSNINEQPAAVRERVRAAFAELAEAHRAADGALEVPVAAVLADAILR